MTKTEPKIISVTQKILVGNKVNMSLSDNKTFELWNRFMSHLSSIKNTVNKNLYSVEVYPDGYFNTFDPVKEFEKYAAVEVKDIGSIPINMESIIVPAGKYAAFLSIGTHQESLGLLKYIFTVWLPASEYLLDGRPHFEVMGDKYKKDDPDSEEEIYIPIKSK